MQLPRRLALAATYVLLLSIGVASAVDVSRDKDKFRQLEEILPTPNAWRAASGAPGHEYWQQRADYVISVELDEERKHLAGSETVTYSNHSPHRLEYLWLQLDPNIFSPESHAVATTLAPELSSPSFEQIRRTLERPEFDGSCEITAVRDGRGEPLGHVIVGTMMRIDLPQALEPGGSTSFSVDWNYAINDAKKIGGRTGYEAFDDGNAIFEIAQWFPRMAAYTDVNGWMHKQYLGSGEFTLEFGDYVVSITVPDDHVVAATGVLQNPEQVLSEVQRERLRTAEVARQPVFVVTPEEAKASETLEEGEARTAGRKTWIFRADDVRDFAFASSRKFIWDAVLHPVEVEGSEPAPVWAMSFYPNEGEPLWSKYSTHAIVHTLDVYSRHTFAYPYPVAISVNGPVGGMEYPMICFNGPRPEKDGTYSRNTKYALISVVIHEVGHNFFPMIVNSDERQWAWMDEGINTFLQFLAEQEWEEDYPSSRGEPARIAGYMRSSEQVPIMTAADSVVQLGSNAYAKPATALNVLRETVMGRELFDFAFRQYARRWRFKRPQPADFFRTLEDASAVDLDWFWNGWFYSTDRCDLALSGVEVRRIDTRDPELEKERRRREREAEPRTLTQRRNEPLRKRIDDFPELADFYNEYDALDVTEKDREEYAKLLEGLKPEDLELLKSELRFYVVSIENVGGLVSPVILEATYEDGTAEELRIPAEVWRRNPKTVTKLIATTRTLAKLVLDPHLETADADLSNNVHPPRIEETWVQLRSGGGRFDRGGDNPMREARDAAEKAAKAAAKAGEAKDPAQGEAKDGGASPAAAPKGGG
jgi:hypothetical protein